MKKSLLIFIFTISISLFPQNFENKTIIVGIADGYSPFQFFNKAENKVEGLDSEIIIMIMNHIGFNLDFYQDNWDDVVAHFKYNNEIDIVTGMEITELRKTFTSFSDVIYNRYSGVFVLENSTSTSLNDLVGKIVTGDRDSYVERILDDEGIKHNIRIKQTRTKEEAFDWLISGKSEAAIMPEMVGYDLAKKAGVKIKLIHKDIDGSPVGIAVKKDNTLLLSQINSSLKYLKKTGTIDETVNKWIDNK